MSMMYGDEKTWKSHYEDWKKVVGKVKHFPSDVTLEQHTYRMEIINRLILDYEVDNFHE